MFNKHDISRNQCQLFWHQAEKGYDWWWHSFTGHHAETGEEKAFFIEYFLCNPLVRKPEVKVSSDQVQTAYLMR